MSEATVEEMKDWQHGQPLALLKEFGAIFKAAHGPHVYGAFGLVKERDIAEAISEGRFFVRPNAAAIYKRLKVQSQQETYHESKITIPEGDGVISAFACSNSEDGAPPALQSWSTGPKCKRCGAYLTCRTAAVPQAAVPGRA